MNQPIFDGVVWSSQVPVFPSGISSPAPVKARFAGAVQDRGEHTFANLWKYRADIQFALHARRKILNFFLAVGVL